MRLRVLMVGLGVVACTGTWLLEAAVAGTARGGQPGNAPARFMVGAAMASIDPAPGVAVYSGGFGSSPPIHRQQEYGPLQVRAIYVNNGSRGVAMAVVDSQAYFAAYQEESGIGAPARGYGITSVRDQAAAMIGSLGAHPRMSRQDIIVQGSHSHSAPTLEGIWGPVPPAYLAEVHDQTVAALVSAARAARPAYLQWATVDAPWLDNIYTAQTDSYAGWTQDGQVSVLRAVDPDSGATVATFANIPAHPDIVNGARQRILGAEYFGAVREDLDARLGGVSLVGPATLGREETFVQVGGLAQMGWYAVVVENLVTEALTGAHWVSDDRIDSSERLIDVPGTNAALLGLNAAWAAPDAQKQQIADSTGIYPIDRADTPPYLDGNVIGTYITALRIGRLAYISMPGEPFPEERLTIARAIGGADMLVDLNKGQDDWGYWFPAWATPFTMVYHSDHLEYNVSPLAGDEIIHGQLANLSAVGFDTTLVPATPLKTDWGAALRPGVQSLAAPASGDAGADGTFTTTLQAAYSNASQPWDASPASLPGQPALAGLVHWELGDGTTADTHAVRDGSGAPAQDSVAGGRMLKGTQFTHAYRVQPGGYTVGLRARDSAGNLTSWSMPIHVYPQLQPYTTATRSPDGSWELRAAATGGDGVLLAAHWAFSDGTAADGLRVVHRFAGTGVPQATLRVVDGTDSEASGRWSAPAAA